MAKRLYKSREQKVLDGVCGGIAEYFHVDAVLIRIIWVILSIVVGDVIYGILAYLIAMIIMPAKPVQASPHQHVNHGEGVSAADGQAEVYAAEPLDEDQKGNENRQKLMTWLGAVLILIGGAALFERIFSIDISKWLYQYSAYLWPLALILLGILLLARRNA